MKSEEVQVRRFYEEIWNRHDKTTVPQILDEGFVFRGSLGFESKGHNGFCQYLDTIHNALASYHCEILELVIEPGKAFARMQFSGIHSGSLLGVEATHRAVSWSGAALFYFCDQKICELWVLGDLKSLDNQLRE